MIHPVQSAGQPLERLGGEMGEMGEMGETGETCVVVFIHWVVGRPYSCRRGELRLLSLCGGKAQRAAIYLDGRSCFEAGPKRSTHGLSNNEQMCAQCGWDERRW